MMQQHRENLSKITLDLVKGMKLGEAALSRSFSYCPIPEMAYEGDKNEARVSAAALAGAHHEQGESAPESRDAAPPLPPPLLSL